MAVRVMVVAVGIVSFSEERSLFVTEVECWRVCFGLVGRDIFDSGGGFVLVVVVEEVNDLELEVRDAFRIVWCWGERGTSLSVALESKVSGREYV